MPETLRVRGKQEIDRYATAEARLTDLVEQALARSDRGEEFATYQLNDFFRAECPYLQLPWEWRWVYGCPRGYLNSMVRLGVTEWAMDCGDGTVEAEPAGGNEVMIQADCLKFGQRFTVWGYVHEAEVDEIPKFVWGRSM